jgi:hypothetical protein
LQWEASAFSSTVTLKSAESAHTRHFAAKVSPLASFGTWRETTVATALCRGFTVGCDNHPAVKRYPGMGFQEVRKVMLRRTTRQTF